VLPKRWKEADPAWAKDAERRLKKVTGHALHQVAAARERLDAQPRQLDGDELDLDAVVRERSDLVAGGGGEQRLYRRLARRRHDWATVVLVDISLSADSGVSGKRVLDVTRDAVMVLGEVARALDDRLLVMAFSSQTRNRCSVWEVSGWEDPWQSGATRLGGLKPTGYTRIGPALRHATARLMATPAEKRLLFLLSDGKPTDYDRYEGRYGIADVRRAVAEARDGGVSLHAFAIDAIARSHFPAQFGAGNWSVMSNVEALPQMLAGVYGGLTRT
jgi:nitric oxide reductase NorD protein